MEGHERAAQDDAGKRHLNPISQRQRPLVGDDTSIHEGTLSHHESVDKPKYVMTTSHALNGAVT